MSNDSQKCAPTFGAGQKNNLSHGPVARVTMAPMDISEKKISTITSISGARQTPLVCLIPLILVIYLVTLNETN